MKMQHVALVAAASLLAACGNPTGSGAGSESNTGAQAGAGVSWMKKLAGSQDIKATVQYPATGLIVEALWGDGNMPLAAELGRGKGYTNNMCPETLFVLFCGKGPDLATEEGRKEALDNSLWPLAIVYSGYRGWEVRPPAFGGSEKEVAGYLRVMEAASEYTANIMLDLASKMTVKAWADPEAAKVEIKNLFRAQNPAELQALWTRAWENAGSNNRTINMTGSGQGSVEWRAKQGNFSGRPAGLIWEKNGQTWLGDGYIAGKKYDIGLASAISKTTESGSSGETRLGGSAGAGASGTAQPK